MVCLKNGIQEMSRTDICTQAEFDVWHETMCLAIQQCYTEKHVAFSIGHAQKWLNMTLKYLCMLDPDTMERNCQHFHAPLDSYIFAAVEKQFQLQRPCPAWSKMDKYDEYLFYQHKLKDAIAAPCLLDWEFTAWNQEAYGNVTE